MRVINIIMIIMNNRIINKYGVRLHVSAANARFTRVQTVSTFRNPTWDPPNIVFIHYNLNPTIFLTMAAPLHVSDDRPCRVTWNAVSPSLNIEYMLSTTYISLRVPRLFVTEFYHLKFATSTPAYIHVCVDNIILSFVVFV